jgi:hypothetical protein
MTESSSEPKDASPSVIAQHDAMLNALPFSDTRDFDDAARGFLGTIESATITNPQGRTVWSLEPYGFLAAEQAPPTVNPSLWRQSRLNMQHGLFEVVPGVYQVRGLDIANMTLIEGDSGVIVVDTLTSIEGARAALDLYFKHRGTRPVAAIVFTHTHTDHWGGARGVLEDDALATGTRGGHVVEWIVNTVFIGADHYETEAQRAETLSRSRAARCRSSRRTCSWSMRSPRTSSQDLRCCAGRSTSSAPFSPRACAGRSIAASASRWPQVRSRCCAPRI